MLAWNHTPIARSIIVVCLVSMIDMIDQRNPSILFEMKILKPACVDATCLYQLTWYEWCWLWSQSFWLNWCLLLKLFSFFARSWNSSNSTQELATYGVQCPRQDVQLLGLIFPTMNPRNRWSRTRWTYWAVQALRLSAIFYCMFCSYGVDFPAPLRVQIILRNSADHVTLYITCDSVVWTTQWNAMKHILETLIEGWRSVCFLFL